jgi:hypothetical protein
MHAGGAKNGRSPIYRIQTAGNEQKTTAGTATVGTVLKLVGKVNKLRMAGQVGNSIALGIESGGEGG